MEIMSLVRVIAETQDFSNYGDENDPYWKAKGGTEYLVAVIPLSEAVKGSAHINETYVEPVLDRIEIDNPMCRCQFIGWELYFEGELTENELLSLQYDGVIDYPPRPVGETAGDGPWCPIWAGATRIHDAA